MSSSRRLTLLLVLGPEERGSDVASVAVDVAIRASEAGGTRVAVAAAGATTGAGRVDGSVAWTQLTGRASADIATVASLLASEEVSLVHAVGPAAAAVARRALLGRRLPPLVLTTTPAPAPRVAPRLAGRWRTRLQTERWLVHGTRAASRLFDRAGLPGERLYVLPLLPVVDLPEASAWVTARRASRRFLGVAPGTRVVAGVGARRAEQARSFATAVARLERRDVIGLWLDIHASVATVHRDERGVVWAGGPDAAQLLAAMDVLVSAGAAYQAHAPCIDAMRAGIPVITTGRDEGSALGEVGLRAVLVPRGNIRALSAAIEATIDRSAGYDGPPSVQLWQSVAGAPLRLLRTTVECYEAALESTLPRPILRGVTR